MQELGEIVARELAGEYVQLTVRAPGVAAGFAPGQFVAVAVGGPDTALLLRRAFALYAADPDGTVQFVVAEHGLGSRWLARQPVGAKLDLVGPLGTPFPLPERGIPVVLVGGGYGTAPLISLARSVVAGAQIEIIVGAASRARLFGVEQAAAIAAVTVTTDDGSAGARGMVTDVLPATIKRTEAQLIYACGPMAMLRAVGDVAREHGIPAYVAVEEAMACGIGVCMTCVLPVRDSASSDGASRFVRSCVDGPVFRADQVRFDDVGSLPHDLVGAEAMRLH